MRIVSLVPSVTETLAELGVGEQVVGVTRYCVHGVPPAARTIGGTKNPDRAAIVALAPDLVITNTEENRPPDIAALRDAGLRVLEQFPRTVSEVPAMLRELGSAVGADAERVETLAREVETAIAEVRAQPPPEPVAALTLIWRKPWMGVGPDTYVDDLLATCGLVNVLAGAGERYPKVDRAMLARRPPQLVVLPSEPYAFGDEDIPALRELVGPEPHLEFVDGELLTWHGQRTAGALRSFSALARSLRPPSA